MPSEESSSADEMVQMTWACVCLLVVTGLMHRVDKRLFRSK